MFIFSLYLVLNSNNIRSSDSMMKPFLRVRYLLLMMGFFALYIGCLYNDFTSIPLPLSKTCYVNKFNDPGRGNFAEKKSDCTYPFGFDHKWYSAENELTFFNSFKMKVSVIFGVLQMVFGIFLKGLNNLYFNSKVDFFCEFIPQILFMVLVFGYMDAMIIIKWLTDWTGIEYRAPNITSTILDMFMGLGSLSEFTRTVDGKEETVILFYSVQKASLRRPRGELTADHPGRIPSSRGSVHPDHPAPQASDQVLLD